MDLMEIAKGLAGASDRVLLILVVVFGARWLMKRDEKKSEEMGTLYKQADERGEKMTEVVTTNTEVLRQVLKKLG